MLGFPTQPDRIFGFIRVAPHQISIPLSYSKTCFHISLRCLRDI
jgi:hypothetical protein